MRRPHGFYVSMAVISVVVVAVGFGPTYYFQTRPPVRPLTALIVTHGAIFTAWMLLYLAQTALAATGRIQWHKRLGIVGGILAILMLVVGYIVAIEGARRGHNPAGWRDSMAFLAVPLVDLVVFAPLVGGALYWRRKPEIHKRLMLLATLSLLGAAFTRMPLIGNGPLGLVPYCALALACPLYDYGSTRRIHPAFLWSALWVVGTVPIRAALGFSEPWHRFALWLTK